MSAAESLQRSCSATANLNQVWTATKFSFRSYLAKRDDGEARLYFTREALERDFGSVTFSDESHNDKRTDAGTKTL